MDFISILKELNTPAWVLIVLVLVNIFKVPLLNLLKNIADFFTNRFNHSESIAEAKLDNAFQSDAVEKLRQAQLDENLMEIIKDKEEFERKLFTDLVLAIKDNTAELSLIRIATEKTNILLGTLCEEMKYDTRKKQ